MLIFIVTITGRSIFSVNSYCDENDNNGEFCMRTNSDMTITGGYICSVSSYCDNNDNNSELYM